MKALLYDGEIRFAQERPRPVPAPGESMIRVLLAAICNTDKEVAKGYKPGFKGIMGHEFVGVVEESPHIALVGKRVVGELNAGCGHCIYCRTGREGHCQGRRVIGMQNKDGCFAEYLTLRTDLLHLVPEGLPTEKAIFTEPLAAALEITEQTHIPPSARVAVVGDGRLAYMISQVLALGGILVTVVGRHPEKLEKFESFANVTMEPVDSYEWVVEATGSPSGLEKALSLVRSRGTIILKSTYTGKPEVDMSRFVVREITLRGSRCGPFAPALQLLARGLVSLPDISLYPLEEYIEAFSSGAFKVGFQIGKL